MNIKVYIKGEHNLFADALSRLPIKPSIHANENIYHLFVIDPDNFPLAYPIISHSQQNDAQLQQLLNLNADRYET